MKTKNKPPADHRFMLVKLSIETADALEDLKISRQRGQKQVVSKRELVQEAVELLVKQSLGGIK